MKSILIALIVIVLVGVVAFVYLGKAKIPQPLTTPGGSQTQTQAEPVTAQNVDSTLNQTDTQVQQTLDQVDQDLKQLDSQSSSEQDAQNL